MNGIALGASISVVDVIASPAVLPDEAISSPCAAKGYKRLPCRFAPRNDREKPLK
jgi:hypothetical protein